MCAYPWMMWLECTTARSACLSCRPRTVSSQWRSAPDRARAAPLWDSDSNSSAALGGSRGKERAQVKENIHTQHERAKYSGFKQNILL